MTTIYILYQGLNKFDMDPMLLGQQLDKSLNKTNNIRDDERASTDLALFLASRSKYMNLSDHKRTFIDLVP